MNGKWNVWRVLAMGCLVAGVAWSALGLATGRVDWRMGVTWIIAAVALAARGSVRWRGYAFTAWVFVFVVGALIAPRAFDTWGGFKLSGLIVPLIQVIMFGMGTTLSVGDFTRILLVPWPVFIGATLQFGVMPATGFLVARMCGFEGELAAGMVLIGSVSGGVASNVIAYLAHANVALSVTMTAVSTLLAPFTTPFLMRFYAGCFVPIDTVAMMFSILNMTLLPVLAGLFAHEVLYGKGAWTRRPAALLGISALGAIVAVAALCVSASTWGKLLPVRAGVVLGGALIALTALAKLIIDVLMQRPNTWMDSVLSLVSMSGICLILSVIIGQTHEVLFDAGILLLVAAVVHNAVGYVLGYWCCKGLGSAFGKLGYWLGWRASPGPLINEADCRTVSIEVGMQNGGMATGLAIDVLRSHVAALPPNVFGAWMNVSGSLLANWWKGRPPKQEAQSAD